ncbi:MAG: thioredoxin family protein [Planctomycetota bacterium]|nr:thioredoxin family protein [Planctomycetota bacterium]
MQNDFMQISVGGVKVGLVGLAEVFIEAQARKFADDSELAQFLLVAVKKRNYVAPSSEENYLTALLREFRRHMGQPLPADSGPQPLEIRVLGPGCVNCEKLEQECIAALAELNMSADFEHVRDIEKFRDYGVVSVPALVINRKVKSIGRAPAREQIKKWILEETLR